MCGAGDSRATGCLGGYNQLGLRGRKKVYLFRPSARSSPARTAPARYARSLAVCATLRVGVLLGIPFTCCYAISNGAHTVASCAYHAGLRIPSRVAHTAPAREPRRRCLGIRSGCRAVRVSRLRMRGWCSLHPTARLGNRGCCTPAGGEKRLLATKCLLVGSPRHFSPVRGSHRPTTAPFS